MLDKIPAIDPVTLAVMTMALFAASMIMLLASSYILALSAKKLDVIMEIERRLFSAGVKANAKKTRRRNHG